MNVADGAEQGAWLPGETVPENVAVGEGAVVSCRPPASGISGWAWLAEPAVCGGALVKLRALTSDCGMSERGGESVLCLFWPSSEAAGGGPPSRIIPTVSYCLPLC